jgi:peptidylprolyl isomerase/peptidyl-prolyl cis-trans isomerase B (cyclophilin B)
MRRLTVLLAVSLAAIACGTSDSGTGSTAQPPATSPPQPSPPVCQNLTRDSLNQQTSPPAMAIDANRAYIAKMTTSKGSFTIALNPKAAPVTVNNFVCLAKAHYYDGLTFHRLVPQFVVQGGDPLGNGTGGPAYKLPNETNSTPWKAGSMAMASNPATGVSGSQFFIVLADGPGAQSLATSGVYNQFGAVTDGFDVVLKLVQGDKITSIDVTEQ